MDNYDNILLNLGLSLENFAKDIKEAEGKISELKQYFLDANEFFDLKLDDATIKRAFKIAEDKQKEQLNYAKQALIEKEAFEKASNKRIFDQLKADILARDKEQKRITKEKEQEEKRVAKVVEQEEKRVAKEIEKENTRVAREKEKEEKRVIKEVEQAYKKSFMGAFTEGTTLGHKFATTLQYATAGTAIYSIQSAFRSAIAESVRFDDALMNNRAVLNVTGKEAEYLALSAREVVKAYGGTIEAADKVTLTLGRAGIEAKNLGEAVKIVAQLSTITGDSFEDTSKVVATFNENFKDTGIKIEDLGQKIAYMANESKMSTEDLGTFANYGLQTAKNLNLTIDSVGALATMMSNLGFSASTIGTEMQKLEFIFDSQSESMDRLWAVLKKTNPELGTQGDMLAKIRTGGAVGEQALIDFANALHELPFEYFQAGTQDMEIRIKRMLLALRNGNGTLEEHTKKIKIIGDLSTQAGIASLSASSMFERAAAIIATAFDGIVTDIFDLGFNREELEAEYDRLVGIAEAVVAGKTSAEEYKKAVAELQTKVADANEKFKEFLESAIKTVKVIAAMAGGFLAVAIAMKTLITLMGLLRKETIIWGGVASASLGNVLGVVGAVVGGTAAYFLTDTQEVDDALKNLNSTVKNLTTDFSKLNSEESTRFEQLKKQATVYEKNIDNLKSKLKDNTLSDSLKNSLQLALDKSEEGLKKVNLELDKLNLKSKDSKNVAPFIFEQTEKEKALQEELNGLLDIKGKKYTAEEIAIKKITAEIAKQETLAGELDKKAKENVSDVKAREKALEANVKLQELILRKESMTYNQAQKHTREAEKLGKAYARAVQETSKLEVKLSKEMGKGAYESEAERIAAIEVQRRASLDAITAKLEAHPELLKEYEKQMGIINQLYDLQKVKVTDNYLIVKSGVDSLVSGMEDFFDVTSEGFLDMEKLATSVLSSILNQMIKVQLAQPIGNALMAGLFPSANGNAFVGGKVQPFATGGVVTQPTLFPMATGTGLMGEAGAEAIMPLERINGSLGVKATPSEVIINIENTSGLPITSDMISQSQDEERKIVNIVIKAASKNTGGFRDMLKGMR